MVKHPVQIPKYIQLCINEGEHQQQDFKMRIDDSRKIARTLVAFANTDGGRIMIGIKDNGMISGVNAEEELHMMQGASEMYTKPNVPFRVQVWKVDYKSILEIIVETSGMKPHQAQMEDGSWKPFIRKLDQNLLAPAVLQEVWRVRENDRPQKYFHTEKEKKIFETMSANATITLTQLSKNTGIPRKVLTPLLARLIRWELADIIIGQDQTLYKLRQ